MLLGEELKGGLLLGRRVDADFNAGITSSSKVAQKWVESHSTVGTAR